MALLALMFGASLAVSAQTIIAGTYNVRYINKPDSAEGNGWAQRCPEICNLIKYQDYDVLGTNEGYLNQLEDMQKQLPGYMYFGTGRNDGVHQGEHCAIFYKKSTVKLLESNHFFLSETPDQPGKAWDAKNPRLCTWGKFAELKSGKIFYFFCVHFDHKGQIARVESSKLMVRKVQEIAGKYPAIVTGDMNFRQRTEGYNAFVNSGVLRDAADMADLVFGPSGSFNGFKTIYKAKARIDHFMVSPSWKVKKFAVLPYIYWAPVDADGHVVLDETLRSQSKEDSYQIRFPSDHFPLAAQLEF